MLLSLSLSLCKSIMLAHIVRINSRTNKSNAHPSSEPQSKVQLQISRWQLNPPRNLATSQPRRVHCHLHRQQTERHKDRKADRQTNKENDFNFEQFGIEDCAQHNNIPCQVQLLLHAWIKSGFMCSCPSSPYLSLCYLCCCLMALRLNHKLTSDREHEHTWN